VASAEEPEAGSTYRSLDMAAVASQLAHVAGGRGLQVWRQVLGGGQAGGDNAAPGPCC
jgi:hypothetical protein